MAIKWDFEDSVNVNETITDSQGQPLHRTLVKDIGPDPLKHLKGEPFVTNRFYIEFAYIPFLIPNDARVENGIIKATNWTRGRIKGDKLTCFATTCKLPETKVEKKGVKFFDIAYNYMVKGNASGNIEVNFVDAIKRDDAINGQANVVTAFESPYNILYSWKQLILNDLTLARGYKAQYATTMYTYLLGPNNKPIAKWVADNVFIEKIPEVDLDYGQADIVQLATTLSTDRVYLEKIWIENVNIDAEQDFSEWSSDNLDDNSVINIPGN